VVRPPQQKPVMPQASGVGASVFLCELQRGVEVGAHLRVGHARDDLLDRLHLAELGHVTLTVEELGGDRIVAGLREPPADVLDVLVDSEDLLHHQDHGHLALRVLRHCAVSRQIAGRDGDLD
jgi:hypothetical protein